MFFLDYQLPSLTLMQTTTDGKIACCILNGQIKGNTVPILASIPGRVFAFITVRRTTRPGTSCLRMRQIFIVFMVGKNI